MVGSRARDFERDGYVAVRGLLDPEELGWYREVYGHRRALIVNFRPLAMVELERARGFDHGKSGPGLENRHVGTGQRQQVAGGASTVASTPHPA